MVLLYHFWQYRAYFSVRYCLKFALNNNKYLPFLIVGDCCLRLLRSINASLPMSASLKLEI